MNKVDWGYKIIIRQNKMKLFRLPFKLWAWAYKLINSFILLTFYPVRYVLCARVENQKQIFSPFLLHPNKVLPKMCQKCIGQPPIIDDIPWHSLPRSRYVTPWWKTSCTLKKMICRMILVLLMICFFVYEAYKFGPDVT